MATTERKKELDRLYDLSVGLHWLADDQNVLIAALQTLSQPISTEKTASRLP
jgi:hypothetical protein